MSVEPLNNQDPLFLASRRMDGELSEEDVRQLEAMLEASPSLRAEALCMEAAGNLVTRWALDAPGVDEQALTARVLGAVRAEEEAELAAVDALISRWARPVEFNERAFAAAVGGKLQPARTARPRLHTIYRIGAPLALAAALGLAVTVGLWRSPEPVLEVAMGPGGLREAVTVVTFNRQFEEGRVARVERPSISILAIGAEPVGLEEEIPPL